MLDGIRNPMLRIFMKKLSHNVWAVVPLSNDPSPDAILKNNQKWFEYEINI